MIKYQAKSSLHNFLFLYRALLYFVLLCFSTQSFTQQIVESEKTFFVDSAGNVFINEKMPVYLFLTPESDPQAKHLLSSPSQHANPMYLDGHGEHFIIHHDPETGKKIRHKVFADGSPPVSKLEITKGLILHFENRFYCEESVIVEIQATDEYSGVNNTFYTIDNSEYKLYETPLIFEKEEFEQITFFSVDNVGNAEKPNKANFIFNLDDVIELENIYFAFDCDRLNADARKQLDELAASLKEFPEIRIELRSHTDAQGSSAYNQRLSERRAKSTRNYLVNKGIAPNRLVAKGIGDSKIINHCHKGVECTDEEHLVNRRTEFRFIPFEEK